jgi:hypothetical protein
MNDIIKESRELIRSEDNDRFIYLTKTNGEIDGINFMQGDDYDQFRMYYLKKDQRLTDFFIAVFPYLRGHCEIDRVNQAIWAYFEYRNLRDARK